MYDVFLSYATEDRSRAQRLATALEHEGLRVFWDRTIPPGRVWREVIGDALAQSRYVIVLWSESSVRSTWVQEEADEARERGILLPVILDRVRPPIGFRSVQAADLSEWEGNFDSAAFRSVLDNLVGHLQSGSEGDGPIASSTSEAVAFPPKDQAYRGSRSIGSQRGRWKKVLRPAVAAALVSSLIGIIGYLVGPLRFAPFAGVTLRAESAFVGMSPTNPDTKLYDFTTRLSMPDSLKARVSQVEYLFDHPSFTQKRFRSDNPANDFAVTYRGWGCLNKVSVFLTFTDNSRRSADFDMCDALGQESAD